MKDKNAIILISGILTIQIIVKILKKIFKINRPVKSKTYGFPSSRAAVISFIIMYLIFKNKFKDKTKKIIIFLGILSLLLKIYLKEHDVYQIIGGVIIGIIFSYLLSKVN